MSCEGMDMGGSADIRILCREKGWAGDDPLTLGFCVVRRDGQGGFVDIGILCREKGWAG